MIVFSLFVPSCQSLMTCLYQQVKQTWQPSSRWCSCQIQVWRYGTGCGWRSPLPTQSSVSRTEEMRQANSHDCDPRWTIQTVCFLHCCVSVVFLCLRLTGADVVDWLYSRVEGFKDRRDARKYASSLLKHGYLRHTVNKITFSEQCYYTFGDLCQSTASSKAAPVFAPCRVSF